jgi:thiamine biosynthesis lipoprotein
MSIHVFSHEAMATHFEVAIDGPDREYARQAAAAAFRETDRLENLLSRYIESSDISRANRLPRGGTTTISDETLEVLLIAADLSLATQRAFDPAYQARRPADLPADAPRFTLDPATMMLTRTYTAEDPLYLKAPYSGQDAMKVSDEAAAPYGCVELSGKNNIRIK